MALGKELTSIINPSQDTININKVVSSNGLAFLSKLLQVYIYKDFFSLLRL